MYLDRALLGIVSFWCFLFVSTVLASGAIASFDPAGWHDMRIVFLGDEIRGYIDGQLLADVMDRSRSNGMVYLASTYNGNSFDNVRISVAKNLLDQRALRRLD